jgi:hypothetical protein
MISSFFRTVFDQEFVCHFKASDLIPKPITGSHPPRHKAAAAATAVQRRPLRAAECFFLKFVQGEGETDDTGLHPPCRVC